MTPSPALDYEIAIVEDDVPLLSKTARHALAAAINHLLEIHHRESGGTGPYPVLTIRQTADGESTFTLRKLRWPN